MTRNLGCRRENETLAIVLLSQKINRSSSTEVMFLYTKLPLFDGCTVAVAISKKFLQEQNCLQSYAFILPNIYGGCHAFIGHLQTTKHIFLNTSQTSSLKTGSLLCLTFTLSKNEKYFLQCRKPC